MSVVDNGRSCGTSFLRRPGHWLGDLGLTWATWLAGFHRVVETHLDDDIPFSDGASLSVRAAMSSELCPAENVEMRAMIRQAVGCGRSCPTREVYRIEAGSRMISCDRHGPYFTAVLGILEWRACPVHVGSPDADVVARVEAARAGDRARLRVWLGSHAVNVSRAGHTLATARPRRWVASQVGQQVTAGDSVNEALLVRMMQAVDHADPRVSYGRGGRFSGRTAGWEYGDLVAITDADGQKGDVFSVGLDDRPGEVSVEAAQYVCDGIEARITPTDAAQRLQTMLARLAIVDPVRALAVHMLRLDATVFPWVTPVEADVTPDGKPTLLPHPLLRLSIRARKAIIGLCDDLEALAYSAGDAKDMIDVYQFTEQFVDRRRADLVGSPWQCGGSIAVDDVLDTAIALIRVRRTALESGLV